MIGIGERTRTKAVSGRRKGQFGREGREDREQILMAFGI